MFAEVSESKALCQQLKIRALTVVYCYFVAEKRRPDDLQLNQEDYDGINAIAALLLEVSRIKNPLLHDVPSEEDAAIKNPFGIRVQCHPVENGGIALRFYDSNKELLISRQQLVDAGFFPLFRLWGEIVVQCILELTEDEEEPKELPNIPIHPVNNLVGWQQFVACQ